MVLSWFASASFPASSNDPVKEVIISKEEISKSSSKSVSLFKTLNAVGSASSLRLRVSEIASGFLPEMTDIITFPVSQRSVSSQILYTTVSVPVYVRLLV